MAVVTIEYYDIEKNISIPRSICIHLCLIAASRNQAKKITTTLNMTELHRQSYFKGTRKRSRERHQRPIGTSRPKFTNVLGGPLTPPGRRSNPGGKRHSHRENSHNCWRMLMRPAARAAQEEKPDSQVSKRGRAGITGLNLGWPREVV